MCVCLVSSCTPFPHVGCLTTECGLRKSIHLIYHPRITARHIARANRINVNVTDLQYAFAYVLQYKQREIEKGIDHHHWKHMAISLKLSLHAVHSYWHADSISHESLFNPICASSEILIMAIWKCMSTYRQTTAMNMSF